eukprot:gene9410-biopygen7686
MCPYLRLRFPTRTFSYVPGRDGTNPAPPRHCAPSGRARPHRSAGWEDQWRGNTQICGAAGATRYREDTKRHAAPQAAQEGSMAGSVVFQGMPCGREHTFDQHARITERTQYRLPQLTCCLSLCALVGAGVGVSHGM